MPSTFRNVDASPDDDVRTWPYEAIVSTIDRGLVSDWQPLIVEIRRWPWGTVARRIDRYLEYRESDGASASSAQRSIVPAKRHRDEVAARVADAVARSGLTNAGFVELVGTSASRLSTYLRATVVPSAAMLIRIERTADAEAEQHSKPAG